jgi:hypothetical protein
MQDLMIDLLPSFHLKIGSLRKFFPLAPDFKSILLGNRTLTFFRRFLALACLARARQYPRLLKLLRIIRQGYFGHGPEVRNPFGQFIDFLVPAWVVARASPKKLALFLPVSGNGSFPVIVSIHPGFDEGDEGSPPASPIRGDAVVAVNYQPYQPSFAGDMGGAAFHQGHDRR